MIIAACIIFYLIMMFAVFMIGKIGRIAYGWDDNQGSLTVMAGMFWPLAIPIGFIIWAFLSIWEHLDGITIRIIEKIEKKREQKTAVTLAFEAAQESLALKQLEEEKANYRKPPECSACGRGQF
jgi:hypothetical protein